MGKRERARDKESSFPFYSQLRNTPLHVRTIKGRDDLDTLGEGTRHQTLRVWRMSPAHSPENDHVTLIFGFKMNILRDMTRISEFGGVSPLQQTPKQRFAFMKGVQL